LFCALPTALFLAMPAPAPLLALYDALFASVLEPDEPLLTVMRKMMLTITFIGAFPMLVGMIGYGAYRTATDAAIAASPSTYLTLACFAFAFVLYTSSYVMLRRTRKAPDWLMDMWLMTLDVLIVALLLSVPAFPIHMCCIVIAVCNVMLQTARLPLHMALSAVVFIAQQWNGPERGAEGYFEVI
jgi:hypothetical protein